MKHYLQTRNNNLDTFDVIDDFFKPMFFDETSEMRTNIKENEKDYELDLELPGYDKNDIRISLDDGYLTVSASKKKEEGKKYLRREISENVSRSYYVGSNITREQVKAKYSNGILTLNVPKDAPQKPETNKFIPIE